jgi:hypothetical protein
MTPKTTAKANRKTATRTARKKSERINRQRRLQKQLQALLLERHSRRCIICHHPEREDIEEEFVHWRSPTRLAHDYKLGDYRTIYRHARAAGLLLQRRERLHSALDAFVESVDDVTFTGDTILRAMRAYSCIDSHGRWTEIPTQVQFSTSDDAHPPQPPTRRSNVRSDVIDIDPDPDAEPEDGTEEDADNAPEERVTALDVLNIIRKYANQASQSDATPCSVSPKIKSRNDATACAASPAQALDVTEDEYAERENDAEDDDMDDDSDADEESEDDAEEAAENELLEGITSVSTSSKSPSHSDTTACAAPPAQPVSAVALNSNHRGRSVTATACADSSVQALPRDVVRGQNPNDRSSSDRAHCAASSSQPSARPAQQAAPAKPKPDADGLIWHPHPGYPNQERSEPDAQGRVFYKIHMTTTAAQLPSRETDAQRAAKLIYGSAIKKYGNP